MKPNKLFVRIKGGNLSNVSFQDLVRLVEAVGFEEVRSRGSHHIFRHPRVAGFLNLQNVAGDAKPYQIRQFLRTMDEHELTLETQ